jgi:trimethylamine:corrinoid methyltransferase-like protein
MREDHLITSPHTLKYWPRELYMTDPVLDRMNRDSWVEAGSRDLNDRACEQVELRLSKYQPFDTDPAIDAEMRRLVTDGLESQEILPELPPLSKPFSAVGGGRRRNRRRRRTQL